MAWSFSDWLGSLMQPNAQDPQQQPLVVGQQGYPNPDPRAYPPGGPQLAPPPVTLPPRPASLVQPRTDPRNYGPAGPQPAPPFYDPTMGRPPPPYDPTMDPRPTPPVPGISLPSRPYSPTPASATPGVAPYARGLTPSQVGQTGTSGGDGSDGSGPGGGTANAAGSYNKGWGTPDSQLAAQGLNKGAGAPDASAPAAGGWGSKLAGVLGNDKLMGGIAGVASGLRGGSQGSGASAPLPPPPNLSDNSAAIAQQAPQLMAAALAKRKKTPGLSLSGVNRGFGGGAG